MKKIVIGINIFYILLWWCHFQVYKWYMQTRRSASHRTENQKKTYKVVLSHRQYCNYAIWGDSAHLRIILKKSKQEIAYFMSNRALLRSVCFVYRQQRVPSACSTDNRFHMFWDMNTKNKDRMMTSHEFDNQLCILRIVHRTTHQAISQTGHKVLLNPFIIQPTFSKN